VGFLRPVAMAKVGIVGLKDDREMVLDQLHDLGVIQVEPLAKEAAALLLPETAGEQQRRVSEELLRFRTLRSALPAGPTGDPRPFAKLEEVLTAARGVSIDAEISGLKREEDRLITERRQLSDTFELLQQHAHFTERLDVLQSQRLLAFFGDSSPEAFGRLRSEVARIGEAAFVTTDGERGVHFLVALPREHADAMGRIAQEAGIHLAAVPALSGTIAEELPRLEHRRAEVDRRLGEIRARLGELGRTWYPTVVAIEEALAIENRKFEVWSRMGAGHASFAVEGWVPERQLPLLEQALKRRTDDRVHLYRISTTEEPPTLMDNPPGVRWFEFFIRFYAIPKSTEFDPTWIFALAFPIFFGFMLGDVGYGAIILGISIWMIAGFPGGQHLPKSLRGFLTMIMGPKGMQLLARTLIPCCVIAIGLGVVYNEYLGFHLPFYTGLFDPVNDVGKLLVVAGAIGLIMVTVGFLLGALKAYYHHHRREVFARSGGILFTWAIATIGLLVLYNAFSWASPLPYVGFALLAGGLGLILAGEGARGLMSLTEIVSHVLSYTRLVGILLSAVILAAVINGVYWSDLTNTSSSIALRLLFAGMGVVILVVGQVFVLVLAVFEPGIQGARLIFVEHFSKFYEGNGRPFHPFGSERRHTLAVHGELAASAVPPPKGADATVGAG